MSTYARCPNCDVQQPPAGAAVCPVCGHDPRAHAVRITPVTPVPNLPIGEHDIPASMFGSESAVWRSIGHDHAATLVAGEAGDVLIEPCPRPGLRGRLDRRRGVVRARVTA